MKLARGTVVLASLDPVLGHEQRGTRPCVVVSDSSSIAAERFPLICIVPITGTPGKGTLYPSLRPGPSGLTKQSFALIDHLRSIDKRRIRAIFGPLPDDELAAIDAGLALYLGLDRAADITTVPQ